MVSGKSRLVDASFDEIHCALSPKLMESSPSQSAQIPLLDDALCSQLFAPQPEPDFALLQKQIWEGIRHDLERDLQEIVTLQGAELKTALHRVRGYCATTSLLRLSRILQTWETAAEPDQLSEGLGAEAMSAAVESLREVERRFPHLVSETPESST